MKFTHPLATCITISIATIVMLPAAYADVHQQDSATIIAKYAAFDTAAQKRDPDAVVAWDAPDYTYYDLNGRKTIESKADELKQLSQVIAHSTACSSKCVVTKIVYDKTGATVLATENGSISGTGPDGQMHMMTIQEKDRDYWINSQGTWMRERSRAISQVMTFDGKPAPAE